MRFSYKSLLFTLIVLLIAAMLLVACGQGTPSSNTTAPALRTTAQTSDSQLKVTLDVDPNRVGQNTFTVHVTGADGKPQTQDTVGINLTMLSMNMGTQNMPMQADGKGGYTTTGHIDMSGEYQVSIAVRTPDHTLHTATLTFNTKSAS